MKNILLLTCFFGNYCLFSQELIPVGTWRTHFNYENTLEVELVGERIFASTPVSLVYYDPSDNSLNTFSKVDGLSDVGISALAYDDDENLMVIGYDNGNIDIVMENEIVNSPILKESQIIYSKRIEDISFYNSTINLSTDFGVIVMDPNSGEITESYQNLGPSGEVIGVNNSEFRGDLMFLASSRGVLMGDRSSGDNLQDFNNWERFEDSPVYNRVVVSVAVYNQTVFAALATSLYYLAGQEWLEYTPFLDLGDNILRLEPISDGIVVLTDQNKIYQLDGSNNSMRIELPDGDLPNDLVEVEGNYWYADNSNGLTEWINESAQRYVLNGPHGEINKLDYEGRKIYAFPSLDLGISNTTSNGVGYSLFESGSWLKQNPTEIDGMDNISDVAYLEDSPYFSSFGKGVLDASEGVIFTEANSTLQVHDPMTGNILVTGMDTYQGALWLSSFGTNPVHCYKKDNDSWDTFDLGSVSFQEPTDIHIYRNGDLWMPLGLSIGNGMLAVDGETFEERHITSTNTSLPSNRVNDIAFDMDGEIWFGTVGGVGYFPTGFGIIGDPTIDMIIPRFEDGFLFQGEDVRAIEIDGGNRKWMATEDGAWLFADGLQDLVYHFNVENSPLPSNEVLDIAIDQSTGEVFFATELGVVSYRADATAGGLTHGNVKIFPNPVLPNYFGQVGFDGLARNAKLKITTVSGRLVREINAAGGGASWDVSDYNGRRVNGGVYMVFSSSPDGSDTYVGKIAVLD